MANCDFCDGRGYITLPRMFRPPSYNFNDSAMTATSIADHCKTFSCPECRSDAAIDPNRIHVVACDLAIDDRYPTDFVERYGKNTLINHIADVVRKKGFCTFEIVPNDRRDESTYYASKKLVAKLGLVSPADVATLERRVAGKIREILPEIAAKAAERIRNWGSHYTGRDGTLTKNEAVRQLEDAFRDAAANLTPENLNG